MDIDIDIDMDIDTDIYRYRQIDRFTDRCDRQL